MQLRHFFRICFAAVFAAAVSALAGAPVRSGGEITERVDVKVIPVRIEAGAPELQRLAAVAFSTHGAFRVDAGAGAAYTLRFEVAGPNAVRVRIATGNPPRVLNEQVANGRSLRNALLKAADAAVLYLTKAPGFFAGRLTFISERTGASEVYTSDLFFSEVLQLTNDRSQAVMPRWSPDGRKILYTGYFRSGFPDIYLIDTATMNREVFVSVKGTNTGARFSPDGTRVAMILSGQGNPELYVSNAQGRQIRRLTRTERQIEATPTWSPDGRRIVVASDALATGKPQLFLISAQGGAMQRIPTNISGYCAEPDWNHANPDLLAFTVASGRGFQIAVYSFKERKSRVVTRAAGDGIEPCWLNDGRHLLYTERTATSQRVHILDTVTGRSTPLSPPSMGKTYQANFVYR